MLLDPYSHLTLPPPRGLSDSTHPLTTLVLYLTSKCWPLALASPLSVLSRGQLASCATHTRDHCQVYASGSSQVAYPSAYSTSPFRCPITHSFSRTKSASCAFLSWPQTLSFSELLVSKVKGSFPILLSPDTTKILSLLGIVLTAMSDGETNILQSHGYIDSKKSQTHSNGVGMVGVRGWGWGKWGGVGQTVQSPSSEIK